MPINLEEQIKLLLELQGLDTRIFRIEDLLESIPENIAAMDERFKEKTAGLKSLEDGVKAILLKRKAKEGDLESKEQSVKKFHSQQNQVKTNKEYTALEEEIGRAKADGSVLEEEILKIFDQIDVENKKIGAEKDFLKAEELKMAAEKKRLEGEADAAKIELKNLKSRRGDVAAKVDKTLLPKYERLVAGKDGLAICAVAGNACQGCFRVLTSQVINEIRMRQELIFCEHCARIIYIEE